MGRPDIPILPGMFQITGAELTEPDLPVPLDGCNPEAVLLVAGVETGTVGA